MNPNKFNPLIELEKEFQSLLPAFRFFGAVMLAILVALAFLGLILFDNADITEWMR